MADHNVVLGGGQGELTGKIFRIGHMGWVEIDHIDEALEAAGSTLKADDGINCSSGAKNQPKLSKSKSLNGAPSRNQHRRHR